MLRKQALTELYLSPDAVGVALLFGGMDAAEEVLTFLRQRKEAIERYRQLIAELGRTERTI